MRTSQIMYIVKCRQKQCSQYRHKSSIYSFIQSAESACYADCERVKERVLSSMQRAWIWRHSITSNKHVKMQFSEARIFSKYVLCITVWPIGLVSIYCQYCCRCEITDAQLITLQTVQHNNGSEINVRFISLRTHRVKEQVWWKF
jgi:hypothetical protein